MVQEDTAQQLFKAKLVALIGMYFGETTASLYKAAYTQMPVDLVEKSSEKLLTEYLGLDRARMLIKEVKGDYL
ncbi:MAG: hypothetical protein HY565_05305 [Candidatus Kerfeldbacteria bacterium]|nr:hypothetical protein [Candidatus Kerfeldbacteria bacterium]